MNDKVYLAQQAAYDDARLAAAVFGLLEAAGLEVPAGQPVLIKPNLLSPAGPERALTTHPLVVRAAAEYVLARGGRPVVADSPAVGSFRRVMREGGYREALADLAVDCRPFERSVRVDIGKPFGRVALARLAVETACVINLAKLKTHTQMLLTLGVKNLFGCIVGMRKPEWHLRSGEDRGGFARLLVQVCRAVAPSVTLVDGVLAMEGQGPGRRGRPRPLGVLAAGANPAAVDWAICRMLGVAEERLPTLVAARRAGMLAGTPQVVGRMPQVAGFDLPELGPLAFGPRPLRKTLRRHLIQRPEVVPDSCRQCGECWQYCPAGAVAAQGRSVGFDYERCIRCYCCIEVCPHGALAAVEPAAGRLLRWLGRLRRPGSGRQAD